MTAVDADLRIERRLESGRRAESIIYIACVQYSQCLDRDQLLTEKLPKQGYNNCTIAITIGLTATKYPYLK